MPDTGTEVYAVLERPKRIWAVAAIHGVTGRLAALHGALQDRLEHGDRVVYLGNYLGHGADIVGTLNELLAFRRLLLTVPGAQPWDIVYLRGTQEEMWQKLLQIQFAPNPPEVLEWMLAQGVGATLAGYGDDIDLARQRCREGTVSITRWTMELRAAMRRHSGHEDLVTALRRYAVSDNGELLFVHAGVDPHRPLSEQRDTFWWGSSYFDDIRAPYGDFRRIVRGFDRSHAGRVVSEHTLSIDGGCGFGGPLNAACLDPGGDILDWIEA